MVDVPSKEPTSSQDSSGNNHQQKIPINNNVNVIIETDGNVITDVKTGDNGHVQETSNDTIKKEDCKSKMKDKNDESHEVVDRVSHFIFEKEK